MIKTDADLFMEHVKGTCNGNFRAIPYRLGLPAMNKAITFHAKDFTDARHWVINHLNSSENYNIIKLN